MYTQVMNKVFQKYKGHLVVSVASAAVTSAVFVFNAQSYDDELKAFEECLSGVADQSVKIGKINADYAQATLKDGDNNYVLAISKTQSEELNDKHSDVVDRRREALEPITRTVRECTEAVNLSSKIFIIPK